MNIKVLESHHFNPQIYDQLQKYLVKHGLPKIGFYHVVAIREQSVIAVGILYQNRKHPYRDYLLVYDSEGSLESSLLTEFICRLEENSKRKRLQLLLNSKNTYLYQLLELNGFYVVRTTYLIELNKLNCIDITKRKTKKLNQMFLNEWIEFKRLFHSNYSQYHEDVNPLAKDISPNQLFETLENINLEKSKILFSEDNDRTSVESSIIAYILIGDYDDNSIEIAYLGGLYEESINVYLDFFQNEFHLLLMKYKTIYFEADDSDYYAFTLIKKLNCDLSNSLKTFIKDIN
ncbi:hypothetical protein [Acinetobacter junii]|uniref:hypothetical protein n=1 Tax=Acinetobacter junii TaxID=40215 RepID=UPI0019022681|nr:hypothetical protein [Acinetobacter junii]MBJ8441689.1 hypothetical protein [Acinetobacter junii]